MGKRLFRPLPEELIKESVGPLGGAQQNAETLGAGRGRGEDVGAQLAEQQSRTGVAQTHDGNQGQEKGAHQTPVCLAVQPLLQRSDERLQQIGNLLPFLPPHPMPQHNIRPLVPSFLCDFFCLYQTPG